jgi:uncharacterized protein (TIGR02147 family)
LEITEQKQDHISTGRDHYPVISKYSSYRGFVRDWFNFKKKQRVGFSYRQFSGLLGLKSPNFMQLVLAGERNISADLAEKLAHRMGLSSYHRDYFLAMVKFEQARTDDEKLKFEKIMLIEKRNLVTNHVEKTRSEVLSQWYHMLVRELVFLPNFKPTGEFISAALNGIISIEEGEQSIQMLLDAGFLQKDSEGRFQTKEVAIDTGDFTFSRLIIQSVHSQTLQAWSSNLEKLGPKEQELGVLHIPISSEKIPELRTRIRRFQDEIIGWLCEETKPDRVVQLGTYLIPYKKIED